MKINSVFKLSLPILFAILASCGPTDNNEPAGIISLEGTSWQLVQIQAVGGFSFVPEDPTLYTLSFGSEGRLTGKSDCNKIVGAWSQNATELSFDPFSASRSLCPFGSLHNHFFSNLNGVQALDTLDGHLLLSTHIEGVLLEFEPLDTGDA